MAPFLPRVIEHAEPNQARYKLSSPFVGSALVLFFSSCVSYQPAPLELREILQTLDAQAWAPSEPSGSKIDGDSAEIVELRPEQMAAYAVTVNPSLVAVRAEIGVNQSLLVQAGLLLDPQIGWDGMNSIADEIITGQSTSVDAWSGLGLMFPLLRPGERKAKIGAAEWALEEARQRIARVEWNLTKDIFLGCVELKAAERLLSQTELLVGVAESTNDYFQRSREAGTATAIQANLALGKLQTIRANLIRAQARVERARQSLNFTIGLPPNFPIAVLDSALGEQREAIDLGPSRLTELALERRPDLTEAQAQYQRAEAALRLAIARQYPSIAIGTGFSMNLPIFSDWGKPAIKTAEARRERAGRQLTVAVHKARREIAQAHTLWQLARNELELVTLELLPNAEKNLKLAKEAVLEGELTLLETLALQGALVEARTRYTEVRAEKERRAWTLLAASGLLLDIENTKQLNPNEVGTR